MFEIRSLWPVFVLLCHVHFTATVSLPEELTITYGQKVALDKFREIVIDRLPHEYMKQDIYLIKWLRAQNFDFKRAESMLMENLQWRKQNKMDTILTEDWSDMESDYPYIKDIFDKQGQPIVIGDIGEWDLRRAFIVGKIPRISRYLDKAMEEAVIKIRKMQEEGKNVTRFIFIVDIDGFNLPQHLCPTCVGRFLQFMMSYENHFPGSGDKFILVNASPVFEFVLDIIKNTVSPETKKAMKVFNQNKQQWQKYLHQFIDRNQLTRQYGGTREV